MMANQQNSNIKRRLWYLGAIIVLIALGLLSRRIRFIPDAFGDALWAMVVYCCFRILLIRRFNRIQQFGTLITNRSRSPINQKSTTSFISFMTANTAMTHNIASLIFNFLISGHHSFVIISLAFPAYK